tara:strand:+ start:380 stop:541 length:162 start_codon:yes stop_codon:yes gene_type:complete
VYSGLTAPPGKYIGIGICNPNIFLAAYPTTYSTSTATGSSMTTDIYNKYKIYN